jgi:hypothetical protein
MSRHTLSLAVVAAMLAACGSDPTGPDDATTRAINLDVAEAAADAAAEDVDVLAGMNGWVGYIAFGASLVAPPDGPGNTSGCGFGGGRFTCPPNSANGLTITRTIAFFDAGGAPQDHYDPATTASIDVEVLLEGGATRGPWTIELSRERHVTWTGLEGTETTRTANGEGSEEFTRERAATGDEPARSYHLEGDFAYDDVVIPVRAQGVDPWPLSGTITRTWIVTRNDDEPITRTVIIEFDGTATPSGTVNGEPFEFDLHNRRAFRR